MTIAGEWLKEEQGVFEEVAERGEWWEEEAELIRTFGERR